MSTVVVLASTDGLYRAGVASILRAAGFVVVEVADIPSAVSAAIDHCSPVCVLDTELDDGVHAHATRRLADDSPARIVAIASERGESDMLNVIRNGGSGYVPRTANGEGLVHAVRAVLAGHLAIPRQTIATLVGEIQGARRRATIGDRRITLTSREQAVLELLEDDLTTQEIASRLGISPVTVRRHLAAIGEKVGTQGTARLRLLVQGARGDAPPDPF